MFASIKKTIGFWLLVLLVFAGRVKAQTVPGVVDNYSGSASVWLNPSNISTTFVHDDLGLMSLSFSLENNFAYLPPRKFWHSLNGLMAEGGTWAEFDGVQPNHPYYYKYYPGENYRNAFQAFDMVVPTMMMSFGGNHSFAFSMRTRAYTSATKMPWEIPVLVTESLDYPALQLQRFTSDDMQFSSLEWEEADFSYSTRVFDHGELKMDAGVTGKLLMGFAGLSVQTSMLDYMVMNKHLLYFYGMDSEVKLALPVAYDVSFRDFENFLKLTDPLVKGFGVGADLGFTLTNKKSTMIRSSKRSACDDTPCYYFWRLGLSLLDLGRVRFNNNALQGRLVGADFEVNLKEFDKLSQIDESLGLLDEFVGSQGSSFDDDSGFTIGLPTALSVQFDMNLYQDFYCNITCVQPVSRWLYDSSVEREPLVSLTPRFETSFFGVSMPVSLYNYRYVTAGAFLRVGPFTLGTNDLLSMTGLGKTRNIDFLVAFRLKLDRGDCLFGRIYDACGEKVRRRIR